MKVLNVIGRILGGVTAVFIMVSLFLTNIEIKVFNIAMYSMSMFEYNRLGSMIILGFAILGLGAAYFNRGFLMSLVSIVIIVADFYTASSMNTGSSEMDTLMNKVTFLFGDVFSPDVGFVFIVLGSIVMFFLGVMIKKTKNSIK